MKPALSSSPTAPRTIGRRQPRRWIPALGALLLLGLIGVGLWPRPVLVEMTRVHVGPMRVTVTEEGKTRVRHRFLVSAPVTGQLRRIELDPGDPVIAGQSVVAVIDPVRPSLLDPRSRSAAEARRDASSSRLDTARRALGFARSEWERFEKLHGDKVVSIQELDAARWRHELAQGEATAAESALRQAEAELDEFVTRAASAPGSPPPVEIKAPVDGRILRVFEENSRVVVASASLLEIGDPTDLEVVIDVLSRDGAVIVPGSPVELAQWGDGPPLTAKVRLVEPAAYTKVSALGVEEQRVNVVADLVSPADQRRGLGDQFRVEARVIIWEEPRALQVQTGAIFRRGDHWFAFVAREGRAHLRPVKPGRSSGTEVQIVEGLAENDEVILYPGDRIRDGERVRPLTI
ncbi:MAG: efflux RND transporter periplasmic adaptor subunit [Limisphaerales bacterium]